MISIQHYSLPEKLLPKIPFFYDTSYPILRQYGNHDVIKQHNSKLLTKRAYLEHSNLRENEPTYLIFDRRFFYVSKSNAAAYQKEVKNRQLRTSN